MSEELPKLLSDEELAELLKNREQSGHLNEDPWDLPPKPVPQTISDGLPESTLEQRFPRVARTLAAVWRTPRCAPYISDLLVNTDRDSREGFPPDVVDDLLMLNEINAMLTGKPGVSNLSPDSAWELDRN